MNKQAYDAHEYFLLIIPKVILYGDEDEMKLLRGATFFTFYFNAEKAFVCESNLFSDKISTGWIYEVHAVWLHMDESKFLPAQCDWITYAERISYYFETNSIIDANRKKAVLLSVCRSETFSLLKDPIAPDSLRDKTFDELSQALEEHCNQRLLLLLNGSTTTKTNHL